MKEALSVRSLSYGTCPCPLDELQLVPVCKGFFLTTVGLNKANDMPIRTALGIKSVQPIDKRGRQAAVNRADHANIKKHIELPTERAALQIPPRAGSTVPTCRYFSQRHAQRLQRQ